MNYLLGNWKMNMSVSEIQTFDDEFNVANSPKLYVGIAVPSIYYGYCYRLKQKMSVGLQNCSSFSSGAYTGEISAQMLNDVFADFCLVGHSERRQYFGETDESVNAKIKQLQQYDILPVVCVGETLTEYESGATKVVLGKQLEQGLKGLDWSKEIVIAYEPVWAIGTGKTATTAEIEEICGFIHDKLRTLSSREIPVLYGGSVKPSNATEIVAVPTVDGVLVGGASQRASDFGEIKQAFLGGNSEDK